MFADRLADAVERKHSQLVVGLDPRLDLLPMELRGEAVLGRAAAASAFARFCKGIVDAVGPYVVAVKPQFSVLAKDRDAVDRHPLSAEVRAIGGPAH